MDEKTLFDTIACGESSRIQFKAREELQRLFQSEGLVYADEVPVPGSSVTDLDVPLFSDYYERRYEETLEESGLPLARLLENLNLFRNTQLNLTGLLLFGKNRKSVSHSLWLKPLSGRAMRLMLNIILIVRT
jgi:predicted HTH transcriptional regulator